MARIYQRVERDKEWWIDYSLGGRRVKKSLKTTDKKTAKLALADLELKLAKKELGIRTQRVKLHTFFDDYYQHLRCINIAEQPNATLRSSKDFNSSFGVLPTSIPWTVRP